MGIPAAIGVAASGKPNLGDQASAVVTGVLTAVGPGDPFAFRGPMDVSIYGSAVTTLTTTGGSASASVASGTGQAIGGAINSVNLPAGTTWKTFSGTTGTLALPAVSLQCFDFGLGGNQQIRLPPGSNVSRLLGATVTVPSTAEGLVLPANTTVLAIIQTDIAAVSGGSTGVSPGRVGIIQLSAAPTVVPPNKGQQPLRFALTAANAVIGGADAAAIFTGASVTFSGTVQLERSFDGGATWIVCNAGGTGSLAQYTAGTPVSLTFGEPERDVLYRVNCIAYTSGTINYRFSQTGGANESLAIGPLAGG